MTTQNQKDPMPMRRSDVLGLISAIVICFAAAGIGQSLSGGEPGPWYAGLLKPVFTPPNWLFAPVWTLLYLMMAVAAWLVWRRRGQTRVALPLALFAIQSLLNAAWTGIFFGLRNPGAGLIEIILLWGFIIASTLEFRKVSAAAAGLMIPYLVWVSFAFVLNLALWRLNT